MAYHMQPDLLFDTINRNTTMQELIKIQEHQSLIQAVDARELHAFLEVKSEFRNWIKNRINDYEFVQDVDFITGKNLPGSDKIDYFISVDMAKELSMVERNKKGKEARKYFIECERRLTIAQNKLPSNYLEALECLIEVEKEKQLALEKVNQLNTIIDNEFGYCSILRASIFLGVHETTFNWRSLKDASLRLKLEVKKVPSPRYGYQNLYPLRAFRECYPQHDFDDLTPELLTDKKMLTIA